MKKYSLLYKFLSILAIAAIAFSILPAAPVQAASTASLEQFASSLNKSDGSQLVGIFASNVMAATIVQQSSDTYVSTRSGTVTQFRLASQHGSIGLLAHNYLTGGSFSKLGAGSEIYLVFGDGSTKKYQVNSAKKYQALSPNDPHSEFVNLNNPDAKLSSSDLFNETFGQGGMLVLQTCISKNGQSSWGRLFIIASPA